MCEKCNVTGVSIKVMVDENNKVVVESHIDANAPIGVVMQALQQFKDTIISKCADKLIHRFEDEDENMSKEQFASKYMDMLKFRDIM